MLVKLSYIVLIAFCLQAFGEARETRIDLVSSEQDGNFELENREWFHYFQKDETSVSLYATLSSPTTEEDIPELYISLYGKDSKWISTLKFSDEICKGEYDAVFFYQKKRKEYTSVDLKTKLQWPEQFLIKYTLLGRSFGKYRYQITLDDEVLQVVLLDKPVRFSVWVDNGSVEIEGLRVK